MVKVREFYDGLSSPFPKEEVKWRIGSVTRDKKRGQALAYVDARAVYNRLDEICSNYGWQCHYSHAGGSSDKTICNLGLYLPIGGPDDDIEDVDWDWIWRANGAGDTNFEGEKGAISDAIKRAAVTFGIGRYLYTLGAPWVQIDERGRIEKSELPKLNSELDKVSSENDYGTIQERAAMAVASAALKYFPSSESLNEFANTNQRAINAFRETHKTNFRNIFKKTLEEKENS